MIGSLLAGTEESPGETILYQGRTFKAYRGMGSLSAMARGSADRYFQEQRQRVPARGVWPSWCRRESRAWCPTREACTRCSPQLTGGLRSGMGLAGCGSIEELRTKARLVRISPAGLKEGHAHDVVITKEVAELLGGTVRGGRLRRSRI